MKRIPILLTGLFFITMVNAQFRSAGLVVGGGFTLVDIEDAIDYSPLEDWDHFAVVIKAVAEYEMNPGLFLVGEVGSNRLYYWEYRWTDGYYGGLRWRSEWTTNIGVLIKKMLNENVYVQAGPAVHIFNSGGTVLGLVLAVGYELPVGDQLTMPFGVRIEPVFGSGIPISLLGNTGIRYHF